ncbi:hypothetical protein [Streptomyces sp. NBC_01304]|uniref:hypothetical protein n=1 Tax=Streptomyces sp. NBC_01304 TaxID=2903818 RepID=UPI002E153407|nr:hypothetical protein OG430_28280 [Streptomyces sp. NBC_01304]
MYRVSRLAQLALVTALTSAVAAGAAVPAFAAEPAPAMSAPADNDTREAVRAFLAVYAPELSEAQRKEIVKAADKSVAALVARPDLQDILGRARQFATQWQALKLSGGDVEKLAKVFVEESAKAKPLSADGRKAADQITGTAVQDIVHLDAVAQLVTKLVPAAPVR